MSVYYHIPESSLGLTHNLFTLCPTHFHRENDPPASQTETSSSLSTPSLLTSSLPPHISETGVAEEKLESDTGGGEACVKETEIEEERSCNGRHSENETVVPHSEQSCEPRETDTKGNEETCVREDERMSTKTQSLEGDQERRSKSPTQPPPGLQKQRSLVSLFAKQCQKTSQSQIVPANTTISTEQLNSKHSQTTLLHSSSLPPSPKLSSAEDFVIGETSGGHTTAESPALTPLERFQQRLIQQMTASQPSCRDHERGGREESGEMVEDEGGETGEGGEGGKSGKSEGVPKPLISDNVISKLKDKPGE